MTITTTALLSKENSNNNNKNANIKICKQGININKSIHRKQTAQPKSVIKLQSQWPTLQYTIQKKFNERKKTKNEINQQFQSESNQ